MIITKSKETDSVLDMLKDVKSVFLIGCSECASLCGTGSPEALAEMKETLEAAGKKVTGTTVAKTGCQVLGTKVELKPMKEETESADAILVMSCGAGTQAMVEVFKDKKVYPANDTDIPRQHDPLPAFRRALLDVRRVHNRQDRRHLPGDHLPQGHTERPLRRHQQRHVRGQPRYRVRVGQDIRPHGAHRRA